MISCVFLCGDRSPYGLAHLDAVARCFDLRSIFIADDARWRMFRDRLSGGEAPQSETSSLARRLLKRPLVGLRERKRRSRLAAAAPLVEVHDANDPSVVQQVRDTAADVLLSAAYPQILKTPVLEAAPRGAVNFHPSLLPRCRGAHPHYWCLATGEQTGGVSAHWMTERIDEGAVLAQRPIDLDGLYYDDLYRRIVEETPPLVEAVANFLADPNASAVPQDDSQATRFRNDREKDRHLDFGSMDAVDLWNRVRAGRSWASIGRARITVDRAEVVSVDAPSETSPGAVVDIDDAGLLVATRDGKGLLITRLVSGRRRQPAADWSRNRLNIGDRLE